VFGAASLAFAAMPAAASQIFISNVAFTDGAEQVSISDFDGPGGFGGGTFHAGRFALTANPGNSFDPGTTSIFGAWCVDVFRTINQGAVAIVYTLGALADDAATPPNPLSATQISRITGLASYGDTLLSAPGSQSVGSAAVQAAIWQTLYPAAVITSPNGAVQSLFATLVATSFSASGGRVLQNFNDQGQLIQQTLFGVPPGGDPFEVPAPAALGLFGLALAALLAARRARA
jgi:hypothetical protein